LEAEIKGRHTSVIRKNEALAGLHHHGRSRLTKKKNPAIFHPHLSFDRNAATTNMFFFLLLRQRTVAVAACNWDVCIAAIAVRLCESAVPQEQSLFRPSHGQTHSIFFHRDANGHKHLTFRLFALRTVPS
jgi:hypothetical protein